MRAAAVNAVFVPRGGVHEWLDEQPERMRFVQLELFEQFAERLGFATAFHQVFELVTDFRAASGNSSGKSHLITADAAAEKTKHDANDNHDCRHKNREHNANWKISAGLKSNQKPKPVFSLDNVHLIHAI